MELVSIHRKGREAAMPGNSVAQMNVPEDWLTLFPVEIPN